LRQRKESRKEENSSGSSVSQVCFSPGRSCNVRRFFIWFFFPSVCRSSVYLWCSLFVCSTALHVIALPRRGEMMTESIFWLRKLKFAFDFQLSLFPVPPLLRLLRSVLFWLSESRFLEKENRIRKRGMLVLHI
jgi:hypothetical protein